MAYSTNGKREHKRKEYRRNVDYCDIDDSDEPGVGHYED